MSSRARLEPGGWTVFAALVLLISGSFNFIYGLAAILNDNVITVGGQGVIIWDVTAWGWIHLILGTIMNTVALALFAVRPWARPFAMLFATLNAIAHVGLITAFPLWSILIITLDVLVIYNLATHYSEPTAA